MRYDLSGSREAPVLLMFPESFGSARMMQGYTDLSSTISRRRKAVPAATALAITGKSSSRVS